MTSLYNFGQFSTSGLHKFIHQLRFTIGANGKTFGAFLRRADEGTLSRLMIEAAILLAASRTNPATVLRDAASTYKVDTDAFTLKVKRKFAKENAKKAPTKSARKAVSDSFNKGRQFAVPRFLLAKRGRKNPLSCL